MEHNNLFLVIIVNLIEWPFSFSKVFFFSEILITMQMLRQRRKTGKLNMVK